MKKFRVTGNFEGRRINETVNASSKKQAKLKAGFSAGFGGSSIRKFMKSRKVKVEMIR